MTSLLIKYHSQGQSGHKRILGGWKMLSAFQISLEQWKPVVVLHEAHKSFQTMSLISASVITGRMAFSWKRHSSSINKDVLTGPFSASSPPPEPKKKTPRHRVRRDGGQAAHGHSGCLTMAITTTSSPTTRVPVTKRKPSCLLNKRR